VTCTLADGSKLLDERGDGFAYQGTVRMHHCHICTGTWARAAPATSAPGLGRGPAPATSAPARGSPRPHLHRDSGSRCDFCTGTWLSPVFRESFLWAWRCGPCRNAAQSWPPSGRDGCRRPAGRDAAPSGSEHMAAGVRLGAETGDH
jgi:hypothetical protein